MNRFNSVKNIATPAVCKNFRHVFAGLRARWKGQHNGLPGIEYDTFGRTLALREIVRGRTLNPSIIFRLANPVSCVRYFEYAYAGSVVKAQLQRENRIGSVLDISSPRLFPLWMVEKAGLSVHMVNPDRSDLEGSRHMARFIKNNENLKFSDNVNATCLPFGENSFDLATSISVIEHVPDDGDSMMISELKRVVRPDGRIILSFPVKPEFTNEYREINHYNRNQHSEKNGRFFFQRFYDSDSISKRILSHSGIVEEGRQYWSETPAGWFEDYERKWMGEGLKQTVHDPELMSKHFIATGSNHPMDRMGICCITLIVNKQDHRNL